jgi:transcriptional regulator with XRE-family HTH domain
MSTRHMGERIKQLRKANGMTQAALATAIGVSRQWVINMEGRARPNPSLTTLLRLQNALGLSSIEDLFGADALPSRAWASTTADPSVL